MSNIPQNGQNTVNEELNNALMNTIDFFDFEEQDLSDFEINLDEQGVYLLTASNNNEREVDLSKRSFDIFQESINRCIQNGDNNGNGDGIVGLSALEDYCKKFIKAY